MAEEKKILIPGRLRNASVGGHVAGTEDIYDDVLEKDQQEINAEIDERVTAQSDALLQETSNRVSGDNSLQNQIDAGIREAEGLVFDTTPTKESANPVLSGGIYTSRKQMLESMAGTRVPTYTSWPSPDYNLTGLSLGNSDSDLGLISAASSSADYRHLQIFAVEKGAIIHWTAGLKSDASANQSYQVFGFLQVLPSTVDAEHLAGIQTEFPEAHIATKETDIDIVAVAPYDGYLLRYFYSEGGSSSRWDSNKSSCNIYSPLPVRDSDEEPTVNSQNWVTSGGICSAINSLGVGISEEILDYSISNYAILSNGKYGTDPSYKHATLHVESGDIYYLIGNINTCRYAFADDSSVSSGGDISLVPGTTVETMSIPNNYYKVVIKDGCKFLLFNIEGSYGTRCFKLGKSVDDRLIKLSAIAESQSSLNIGDVYYNSRSDIKQLRKKTGNDGDFITVPFHDGSIYTYNGDLYIWNGSDLVSAGFKNSKQYIFSSSAKKLSDMDISITALGVKDLNGYTRTVYADPVNHTAVIFHFSGTARWLVLTENDEIVQRTSASSVLSTDCVLLVYNNQKIVGGELLPIINNSSIVEKYGTKAPIVLSNYAVNSSGKIKSSDYDINTIYFIAVEKGDIVHITASDEVAANFRTGFIDNYPTDNAQLHGFKDNTDYEIDYYSNAPFTGFFVAFHVSTRYSDMAIALEEPEKHFITISTSNTSTYNKDGSIYIYDLYITYQGTKGQQTVRVRDTIQPLENTFCYVLTADATVEAKLSEDMLPTDVLLLRVSVNNGVYNYFGGLLYADYLKKCYFLANNPFEGMKLVCTGGSSMEGYAANPGPIMSEIVGAKLKMLSINYAIAGSAIAKHQSIIGYQPPEYKSVYYIPANWEAAKQAGTLNTSRKYMVRDSDIAPRYHIYEYKNGAWSRINPDDYIDETAYIADYDECFVKLSDWETAIEGDTLDTSKTYLVHDTPNVRPFYHLYKYSDGNWNVFNTGDSSIDNAKAPLVDRIKEMDTDADVILLDSGGNDWAHYWVPMGDDFSRDKSTFYGAMHLLCRYLMDTYPGKVIIWLSRPAAWRYSDEHRTPSVWYDNFYIRMDSPNPLGYTNGDYVEAQKTVLRQYGIQYFDLGGRLGFSQQNRWWCGDAANGGFYAHPNAQAQPLIADVVIKEMLSYKV